MPNISRFFTKPNPNTVITISHSAIQPFSHSAVTTERRNGGYGGIFVEEHPTEGKAHTYIHAYMHACTPLILEPHRKEVSYAHQHVKQRDS